MGVPAIAAATVTMETRSTPNIDFSTATRILSESLLSTEYHLEYLNSLQLEDYLMQLDHLIISNWITLTICFLKDRKPSHLRACNSTHHLWQPYIT